MIANRFAGNPICTTQRWRVASGVLILFALASSVPAAERQDTGDSQRYVEASLDKIEARTFGMEEKAACESAAMRLPPNRRAPYLLVLGRYCRVLEKRPVEALRLLGPQVWPEKEFAAWIQEQEKAEKSFRLTPGAGLAPNAVAKVLAACPAVTPAHIAFANARSALEMGRCFADLERYNEALAVFDAVGAKFDELLRARASDGVADVMVLARDWPKALHHFRFALQVLDATARYNERAPTPEEQNLRGQILAKLARVERELEKDKYGADWVSYRNAELKRRKEKDYLDAYLRFRQLIADYPKTIYAEASECYAVDCLLALYPDAEGKKALQKVAQAKTRLKEMAEELRKARSRGLPAPALEELAQKISAQESQVRSLEQVSTGPKAVNLAEERAFEYLKRSPAGLYRGEVQVMLGRHYLDAAFDPARAEENFSRAARWFSEKGKHPPAAGALEVPAKARQVSKPPAQDRAADDWTNVIVLEPKPGDVVNETTCSWYVRRLHREAVLKWGLTAYARGDIELAKKLWESLHEIDPFFAEEEKKGWGSAVELLLWNLNHQPGCLYAEPAELASFSHPSMRLGVLLADLAFCNNEFPAAEGKYRALLAEPFGRLTKPEKSFLTFALARSLDMQFKEKEVDRLIAGFDKQFADTPTMPRFLLWRGNRKICDLTKVKPGTPAWASGIRDYTELIRQFPNTVDADCACYYLGWNLYQLEEFDQARERFEAYLRQYPSGIWKDAAVFYLEASKKRIPIEKL